MDNMKRFGYPVQVYHLSAELGGGYMATVDMLPGCVGVGYSVEEAVKAVEDVVLRWVESQEMVPLSLPRDLYYRLSFGARRAGMSPEDYVGFLLASYDELAASERIAMTEE